MSCSEVREDVKVVVLAGNEMGGRGVRDSEVIDTGRQNWVGSVVKVVNALCRSDEAGRLLDWGCLRVGVLAYLRFRTAS
jgi:hypothetical protein